MKWNYSEKRYLKILEMKRMLLSRGQIPPRIAKAMLREHYPNALSRDMTEAYYLAKANWENA